MAIELPWRRDPAHDRLADSAGMAREPQLVRQSLARPYKVTLPMVVLVGLVPIYLFMTKMVLSFEAAIPLCMFSPLAKAWARRAVVFGIFGLLESVGGARGQRCGMSACE